MIREPTLRCLPASLSLCALVFACTLAAPPAGAADTPAPPPGAAVPTERIKQADSLLYRVPFEQVVTAPRQQVPLQQNPAATTVIQRDLLQRTMPRAIEAGEALALVPGVRVDNQSNGGLVHLSIRGQGILTESGIRGIKVLLDGLPVNDPSGVAPDLLDVDWATVDHIEVLRGPSGALYGGGGSGGVLNIVTLEGGPRELQGSASAQLGTSSFWRSLVEGGGTSGNVNYHLSVSRTGDAGYRVHSAYSGDNAYEKLRWTPREGLRLTQILGWSDHLEENPEGLNWAQVSQDPRLPNPDALTYNEFFETNRFSTGLLGELDVAPGQVLQASAYYRGTQYRESVPSNVSHRAIHTPGLSVQYNLETAGGLARARNHLAAGVDLAWQNMTAYGLAHPPGSAAEDTLVSNQEIWQRGAGLFLLDWYDLGGRVSLMAAVRYDDLRNQLTDLFRQPRDFSGSAAFHRVTGRVGASLAVTRSTSLYANWGQGFLPPSTKELLNNPAGFGGFNTALVPATSHGEEVGARGMLGPRLAYDVALFHLVTDGDFDRYRLPDRPLETFYRNIGSSRRYGVETLIRCRPVDPLALEAAYTYSDFRYTNPTGLLGHQLPNCPQHQLALVVDGALTRALRLGITCEAQSHWEIDSGNSTVVPGFTLWGARATYTFPIADYAFELSLAGRNLFNQTYEAFTEPDPDGNSYHPGPRREIFGGLRVSF